MNKRILFLLVALVLLGTLVFPSLANGGGFMLPWWVIGGGGGQSSGGNWGVWGTAAQSIAGTATGGDYGLYSGYWAPALAQQLYLPLVLKGS
ncbi:MAG: hypothetical protein J7M05_05890 [Anaerolineae bacterium]|nr:hypothetical protein [Anaerolineae bacterium]